MTKTNYLGLLISICDARQKARPPRVSSLNSHIYPYKYPLTVKLSNYRGRSCRK
jgi:hypothetical protein